jgi:hypothetical protein
VISILAETGAASAAAIEIASKDLVEGLTNMLQFPELIIFYS